MIKKTGFSSKLVIFVHWNQCFIFKYY